MKDSERFKAKYEELLNNEEDFDRTEALRLIGEMLLEVIRLELEYIEDENSYTPPEFREDDDDENCWVEYPTVEE